MPKISFQDVLVYLQPFCHNSLLKSALQPKNSLKTPFGSSQSFMVIDVNKSKKPVASACYAKQHVCTYLQSFLRYKPKSVK